MKKKHRGLRVIKLEESAMLFPGGKPCRENPISTRGMKQGLRAFQGVSRQEVEKTCRRNVSGEVNPSEVDLNRFAL
jgi:hypothetical protein